jgi:outer membrane protein
VIWWCWAGVALADPLALDDALREALDRNPELRQEDLRQQMAEQARRAAAGVYDPTLQLSVDTTESSSPSNSALDQTDRLVFRGAGWTAGLDQALPTGGTASVGWTENYSTSNSANVVQTSTVGDNLTLAVSQPLLSGLGSTLRGVRNASLAADDAALSLRQATEQLVLDVSAAYWRLVSSRESLALALKSREIAVQSLADTRERFDEGFAGSGDVAQVERALGSAQQAEVIAAAEVDAAETDLCRILGRDVTVTMAIEPTDRPVIPAESPPYEDVLARAQQGNVQWLRERLALERAELDVRDARFAALPDLSVVGQLSFSGLDETAAAARRDVTSGAYESWSLGASLSVPLPGRATAAALATARLDAASARLTLETAAQDLVLRVRSAVRAVARDRSRVTLAEDTVRFARLALAADQELLQEGKGATLNVVLSLEALDQAQAQELQAQIDLQVSLLELERVAGNVVGTGE